MQPVPPEAGTFCDPVSKTNVCVQFDFRNGTVLYEGKQFALKSSSILNYSFSIGEKTIEVEMRNENRAILIGTDGSQKLLLRLKDKQVRKKQWARLWWKIKETLGLAPGEQDPHTSNPESN
ncbi:hypothetical protein CH373_08665 [Leptospira perolatii]|uniref:Uncharacterized protein n=2 Tax=Leptospira perolatii TaxID=2023191 RepID=A0A2M9ZNT1_9LEPT|nr:hypothetical protein CH360_09810 [Leptospira perolatii]PJZ73694.1 hypothetical protein CH373_08665 [Leptospira perolatii]